MLAENLGVRDSLIITGRLNHSDIPAHIALFNLAIIPNSNEYRSPIKLFEYMAMGKPIVAPDRPPIVSVIKDGTTGFIFMNGNQDDLCVKMDAALASFERSQLLGSNAQQLVLKEYTWDMHAKKILSFLS
jgi:glycosyltransferase involved in cell wall biosynthesis